MAIYCLMKMHLDPDPDTVPDTSSAVPPESCGSVSFQPDPYKYGSPIHQYLKKEKRIIITEPFSFCRLVPYPVRQSISP